MDKQLNEDLFGRGAGDPDHYPLPDDPRWVGKGKQDIVEYHHPDSELEIIDDDGVITNLGEVPF